jgi:hypothetical protein
VSPDNLELFEPRASECADMASKHLKRADQFARGANAFSARGYDELARQYRSRAAAHAEEASCLAMYADLCRRAGVQS